jgi:hypothetical protein
LTDAGARTLNAACRTSFFTGQTLSAALERCAQRRGANRGSSGGDGGGGDHRTGAGANSSSNRDGDGAVLVRARPDPRGVSAGNFVNAWYHIDVLIEAAKEWGGGQLVPTDPRKLWRELTERDSARGKAVNDSAKSSVLGAILSLESPFSSDDSSDTGIRTLLAVRHEASDGLDSSGPRARVWVHSGDVNTPPTPVSEIELAEMCRRCDFCAVVVVG